MKLYLQPRATSLRKQGFSIKDISAKLGVSESTVSLWCRAIILTKKQKTNLEKRTNRKLDRFFKLVARQKHFRDIEKRELLRGAEKRTLNISEEQLFISGVALYWAEGFKHVAERRLGFCNSDPTMIKFQIIFWKKCLGVSKEDITARLTLNEQFKDRTHKIEEFWSKSLQIPKEQFTKPFYQKVKTVKTYTNADSYHGVLRIHARKSSKLMVQMRGYIKGLGKCSVSIIKRE